MISPQSLTRLSSRHPWFTVSAWVLALTTAIGLSGALLGDALTTDMTFTNNPDATIVRTVLVPASMKLLGTRNWYLPPWLQWFPELQVEGTEPLTAVTEPALIAPHPTRAPAGLQPHEVRKGARVS